MAKKKKIDLKRIVADALDYYHNYVKKTIKESTKRQNESLLSEFYRFVDTLPARDKTMKIFSQKGLNRYKEHLIDKMERSKTDGRKRNFGVGQLNRCGAIIALIINQVLVDKEDGIVKVSWNKVDDPRREDQKGHIPLLDDEVAAIENCADLTPVEEVYRDIFLLQVESGHRVSDLCKILTGKYWIEQGDKEKFIVFSTEKENTKGRVIETSRVITLIDGIQSQKLIGLNEFEKKTKGKGNNTYNEAIRRIAKKAGLDREIVRVNASQIEKRNLLFETISSHDARCTFITKKLIEGWPPDKLCWLTGHASDDMIKRVYAQLTDKDKLRAIESVLSSCDNEKGTNSPTDTSSNQPTETEEDVSAEIPNKMHNNANKMPTVLFTSNRPNDLKSYFEGLKNIVDTSLGKINDDDLVCNELLNYLKQRPEIVHLEEDNPHKRVNVKDLLKDMPKDDLSTLGDVLFASFAEKTKESKQAEGCGLSSLTGTFSSNYFLQRRITYFAGLFMKLIPYVMYNRPIVDEKQLELTQMQKLNHFPEDLTFVLRELQKVSGTKLEMIIKYTDCPREVQIRLLNAIITDNLVDFSNAINEFERETSILINYACNLNYVTNKLLNPGYILENSENICTEEGFDFSVDLLRMEEPFMNKKTEPIDINYPSFNKESLQSFWGKLFDIFQVILKHAYKSEKRILGKISKQIEKYPELKDAYDEYKAKQNTSPDPSQTGGEDVPQNAGNDLEAPKAPKGENIVANYISFSKTNLDVDKLIELLTEDNKLNGNKCLITLLECDKDADVKTCLNYFLKHTKSLPPLSFKFKWNRDNKVGLKFLIRLLVNTNNTATRRNVIKYEIVDGAPDPYDGISKYVSDGKGQKGIWPSVKKVFDKCDSIMQANLGKTESAWEKNRKQLETVAKIYFACKK